MSKYRFTEYFGYKEWQVNALFKLADLCEAHKIAFDGEEISLDNLSLVLEEASTKKDKIKKNLHHMIGAIFDKTIIQVLDEEDNPIEFEDKVEILEKLMDKLGTHINYGNYKKDGITYTSYFPPLTTLCGIAKPSEVNYFLNKFPDYDLDVTLSEESLIRGSKKIKNIMSVDHLYQRLSDCNYTALFAAVYAGKPDVAETLIKLRANKDFRDPENQTILHIALSKDDVGMFKTLIKLNVDFTKVDSHGLSILDEAITSRKVEIAKLLIDAKFLISPDSFEYTSLDVNNPNTAGITSVIYSLLNCVETFSHMIRRGKVKTSDIKDFVKYFEILQNPESSEETKLIGYELCNRFKIADYRQDKIDTTLSIICKNIRSALKKHLPSINPKIAFEFAIWDHEIINEEIKLALFARAEASEDLNILDEILDYYLTQSNLTGYEKAARVVDKLIKQGAEDDKEFALIRAIREFEIETGPYRKDFNLLIEEKVKFSEYADKAISKTQARKITPIFKILSKMDQAFVKEAEKKVMEQIVFILPELAPQVEKSAIEEEAASFIDTDDAALSEAISKYERELLKKEGVTDLKSMKLLRDEFASYKTKEISKKEAKTFGKLIDILERIDVDFIKEEEAIVIEKFKTLFNLEARAVDVTKTIDNIIALVSRGKPKKPLTLEDEYAKIKNFGQELAKATEEGIIVDTEFNSKLSTLNSKITLKNDVFKKAKEKFRFEPIKITSTFISSKARKDTKAEDFVTPVKKTIAEFDGDFSPENLKLYAEYFKENPDHEFCVGVRIRMGYTEASKEERLEFNNQIKTQLRKNISEESQLIKKLSHSLAEDFIVKFLEKSDNTTCKDICVSLRFPSISPVSSDENATPIKLSLPTEKLDTIPITFPDKSKVDCDLLEEIYEKNVDARNLKPIEKLINSLGADFTYGPNSSGGCTIVCSKSPNIKSVGTHNQHGRKADSLEPGFISDLKKLLEDAGVFAAYQIGKVLTLQDLASTTERAFSSGSEEESGTPISLKTSAGAGSDSTDRDSPTHLSERAFGDITKNITNTPPHKQPSKKYENMAPSKYLAILFTPTDEEDGYNEDTTNVDLPLEMHTLGATPDPLVI